MNKNRLLFFLSMTVLFFAWMYFDTKPTQNSQAEASKTVQIDSVKEKQEVSQATITKAKTQSVPVAQQQQEAKEIFIETNKMSIVFDVHTAQIQNISLNTLFTNDTNQYVILDQSSGDHFALQVQNQDLKNLNWQSNLTGSRFVVQDSLKVIFKANLNGTVYERHYTIYAKDYRIRHQFKTNAGQNASAAIYWTAGIKPTEDESQQGGLGQQSYDEFIFSNGETISREKPSKPTTFNQDEGSVRWFGLRHKYVAVVANFNRNQDYKIRAKPLVLSHRDEFGGLEEKTSSYEVALRSNYLEQSSFDFDIMVLPLQYNQLVSYEQGYEKILFLGYSWFFRADLWYVKLAGLVLNLLNWFYSLIPNYGIAIICLTLLIRFLLLPLTISQTRSMGKLQEHAPVIKKIRDENKGNPQKTQREIMSYYKAKGVNPAAGMLGCLPMVFQFPVFIALFHVLGRAVELKGVPFLLWVNDLSQPDVIWSGFTIPYIFPSGITVLPFLMAGTMYFQTKMTMTDPNQKMLVWMMPLLMFVFSASFPSGLVLYWTISNLFTIFQTKALKKKKTKIA